MTDLSIIIPHYNTPRLLKKLLDSIPILDSIQVIVIDDNSSVEVELFNDLRETYKHVVFRSNETGKNSAGTCRNIGMQYANGRWVLFADSDDYFEDGFYEIVHEYFDSEYDVVYFTPKSYEIGTNKLSSRHLHYVKLVREYLANYSKNSELRLRYAYVSPWSKLISRECLVNNDIYFEDTVVANDVMFSIKLGFYLEKFAANTNVIYNILTRKESLTTTVNEENILIRLEVFVRKYKFLKEKLSKKDFRCLDMTGSSHIFAAIQKKCPPKLIIKMIIIMKKNKVRLIRKRHFNPAHIYNEIKTRNKKRDMKYYAYRHK